MVVTDRGWIATVLLSTLPACRFADDEVVNTLSLENLALPAIILSGTFSALLLITTIVS